MLSIMSRGARVAGHFQADVEAFLHAELAFARRRCCFDLTFTATVAPMRLRQGEAVLVHVGDDDVACAGVLCDAAAMMPMGPAPVMRTSSPMHRRQRGVHGVAEGIEDARHLERPRRR
jgi:hypothetical protein